MNNPLDKAALAAALKTVKGQKRPEGYLKMAVGYSEYIVVPYKDGLKLLEALEHAEFVREGYSEPPEICELGSTERFQIAHMSQSELNQIKMAKLLLLPLRQVKEAMEKETKE